MTIKGLETTGLNAIQSLYQLSCHVSSLYKDALIIDKIANFNVGCYVGVLPSFRMAIFLYTHM